MNTTSTTSPEKRVTETKDWYWKPSYPNYAPSGVPDYDQQQDAWKVIEPGPNGVINSVVAGDDFFNATENRIVPGPDCHLQTAPAGDDLAIWAFCGPVAVANCLWWYDSKYSDPAGTPGDGKDNLPLVGDYGAGDDHSTGNVPLLIEELARAMKTNTKGTTYVTDMNNSLGQWFITTDLSNHFTVNTTNEVTFPYVEEQIEDDQNVILLVGAYQQNTTKTIDQQQPLVAYNDNLQPQNWWDYQSFTPSVNRLDAIQVCLVSNGPACDVQVTVYNTFGGPALGTSILNPGFLAGATWIQFHFTPFIPLTPGANYYFDVREVPTPDAYHYEWFYAQPPPPVNPYPLGNGWMNGIVQPDNFDWTFKTEYYGGHRVNGHYLTCAGVNSAGLQIAVSDPINDVQNPTGNHTSHNNALNVSQDIYNVSIGSPYPNLPYHWWLSGYPDGGNITVVEQAIIVCSSNSNPNKPTKPSGPNQGTPGTKYSYTTITLDPDGDKVYYLFDWGDGTNSSWVGPYNSGITVGANHTWTSSGTYLVKVKAKDTLQAESTWSDSLSVQISVPNTAPNKPSKPSGNIKGKVNVEYTYTTSTTDPDGDKVYYLFDWGDGTNSSWVGPYNSGATASAKHKWTVKGPYQIKVKAKDTNGAESLWSDPLSITMPFSYQMTLLQFLQTLLQRFPHAFPLLRQLFGT